MKLVEITNVNGAVARTAYEDARDELVDQYPELDVGGGIGLCAFASAKLKEIMADDVKLEVIIGRRMVDTPATDDMWEVAHQQWKLIPKDDVRYKTAKYFLSHDKKKKDIGHAVCYDGNTIIDVTSDQFGIPMFYSFDEFKSTWDTIKRNVNIKINDITDFGSV